MKSSGWSRNRKATNLTWHWASRWDPHPRLSFLPSKSRVILALLIFREVKIKEDESLGSLHNHKLPCKHKLSFVAFTYFNELRRSYDLPTTPSLVLGPGDKLWGDKRSRKSGPPHKGFLNGEQDNKTCSTGQPQGEGSRRRGCVVDVVVRGAQKGAGFE